MSDPLILIDKSDAHITTITLNRPQKPQRIES